MSLTAFLMLFISGTALARDRPVPAAGRALTGSDAEAWLDGYMPYALASADIPGAVVTIVKDGRPILSRGYGLADVARATPVDAATTIFRVGSVSKLFTWTAVMQLTEKGQIDLDADINRYLDFTIPEFKGQPVTMRQLMTHTAGFEEARRGIASLGTRIVPLGQAVKRHVPRRIFAPGTTPSYSNYGTALAGYIVERVSGEPFDHYIQRHIFDPLAMTKSTFVQPLPRDWSRRAAQGYVTADAPSEAFEIINWSPAGGLSATGDDMAHFMIAQLEEGSFGKIRILGASTARRMTETPLTFIAGVNRSLLGYYELDANGRRAVGHHGDTVLFHALLALYPDEDVGIFMAFNAMGRDGAVSQVREQLFERFNERYFPPLTERGRALDPAIAREHARMFAGAYENSRGYFTSFLTFTRLVNPITVTVNHDGSISLSGYRGPDGQPKRFREITPFRWKQVGGPERIAVIVEDGQIARFAASGFSPNFVMLAVPLWRSPVILRPAFLLGATVMFLFLLAWPTGAFIRWRHGLAERIVPARARARQWMRVSALLTFMALCSWVWLLGRVMVPSGIYRLSEYDPAVYAVQGLTIVGFGGAMLAAGWKVFIDWRERAGWIMRGGNAALLLATAAMVYTAAIYRMMALSVEF